MLRPTYNLFSVREYEAKTYYFRWNDFGWASVTINDATGELSIQSDWGNFAYRWSPDPKHLGHATLTRFLADRSDIDYVMRKLLSEDNQINQVLDDEVTLRNIYDLIRDRRRDGMDLRVRDRYEADRYKRVEFDAPLRARLGDEAKEFVEEIVDEHRNFWDVWGEASDEFRGLLGDEPYEILGYRDRRAGDILAEVILPALVRHLRAEAPSDGAEYTAPVTMQGWHFYEITQLHAEPAKPACNNYAPPSFAGHWREWHRGHGCNLDDGRAPAAVQP